ncbi:hypothetical protein RFI_00327 [Reticulomyxa filosa]|uniref:Uncharacterized protein n=1 Tax=Reticulomyxa filosa TaxID=46433 RepID=X6PF98_RETFI|nr:hypothetical protein RFI_00327 [Reticulomyxa filosa]|eukprot:ETO36734.1 hypothetical protein RFI_00327 [Reticulomyxa filosa]
MPFGTNERENRELSRCCYKPLCPGNWRKTTRTRPVCSSLSLSLSSSTYFSLNTSKQWRFNTFVSCLSVLTGHDYLLVGNTLSNVVTSMSQSQFQNKQDNKKKEEMWWMEDFVLAIGMKIQIVDFSMKCQSLDTQNADLLVKVVAILDVVIQHRPLIVKRYITTISNSKFPFLDQICLFLNYNTSSLRFKTQVFL